jgi:hypothetical protein
MKGGKYSIPTTAKKMAARALYRLEITATSTRTNHLNVITAMAAQQRGVSTTAAAVGSGMQKFGTTDNNSNIITRYHDIAMRRSKSTTMTMAAAASAAFDQSIHQPFPSIVIGPQKLIQPQGSFAEAQAQVRNKNFSN